MAAPAQNRVFSDFAILGAGAIGSILGAHLARAGHSVVMLARGRRADEIRKNGLRVTGLVELNQAVQVVTDSSWLKRSSTLVIATKSIDTANAVAALRHTEVETVFSIQNGVLKDEVLTEVFGETYVLGAVADISGETLDSGEVIFTRNVNLHLGGLGESCNGHAARVARMFNDAGVHANVVSEIRSLLWSKFVGWLGLLVVSVTLRLPTWRCLSDPDSARILVRLVREAAQLSAAQGVRLSDQAVIPVASLCQGTEEGAVARVIAVGREFERCAPEHRTSSLQDLEAIRPMEIHETIGHAVHKAGCAGLSVPLLSTFYALFSALERGRGNTN